MSEVIWLYMLRYHIISFDRFFRMSSIPHVVFTRTVFVSHSLPSLRKCNCLRDCGHIMNFQMWPPNSPDFDRANWLQNLEHNSTTSLPDKVQDDDAIDQRRRRLHARLQNALQHISWMTSNLLTLNSSKTEFLLIGLQQQLTKIHNCSLSTTDSARNLGFIFDSHLTFSDQILFIVIIYWIRN